jgi:peptide/nickel transport system permease protein
MLRYVIRRLLIAIPILLFLSIIVFMAARASSSPEAAIRLNPRVSAADIERYRANLGLDKSNAEQYAIWLGNFAQGDLGDSLVKNRPVWPLLKSAIGNTLVLGLAGISVALLIGIAIGTLSAIRQYSWFDNMATGGAFLGLSMPQFWFALILQLLFGVWLIDWLNLNRSILPISGMKSPGTQGFDVVDRVRHLVLPATVLAVQLIAVYSRYMRASMLEVLHSDYLRTARAKGLRESRVIIRHGVRTALIPVTTQAAIDLGLIVGGLIITEQIFQWPGMGVLFLDAMASGDYQIILPWLMITSASVILLNLAADVLYAFLDPRIRYD